MGIAISLCLTSTLATVSPIMAFWSMRRVCCALVIASIWAVGMTQEHGISLDAADSEVAAEGPVAWHRASLALVQTEATKKTKVPKKKKTKPQQLKTATDPKKVKKSKFVKRPSGTFPTKK